MASEEKVKIVVIVDDDESMCNALRGFMKEVGLAEQAFASAEEFLDFGHPQQIGCVIADIRMPGMSGLELQAQLQAQHCNIPIIFITGNGDEKMRLQALRAGAVEFLSKPFDDEILLESVRAAMNN
jgi:FixJ family two-component response regulator